MARPLSLREFRKTDFSMLVKEEMRLGQKVLYGDARESAVVDGLTQTFAGLRLDRGGYVLADYSDVHAREDREA